MNARQSSVGLPSSCGHSFEIQSCLERPPNTMIHGQIAVSPRYFEPSKEIFVLVGHMLSPTDPSVQYTKIRILDKSKLIQGQPVTWTDFFNFMDPGGGTALQ